MINITLLSSVAKSALVGAVATKLVDTFISTKVSNKIEYNKWLRKTKLELYSNLINEVLNLNESNSKEKIYLIKRDISKVILLVDNKNIAKSLENYIEVLNKYEKNTINEEKLKMTNQLFISYLKTNLKV